MLLKLWCKVVELFLGHPVYYKSCAKVAIYIVVTYLFTIIMSVLIYGQLVDTYSTLNSYLPAMFVWTCYCHFLGQKLK